MIANTVTNKPILTVNCPKCSKRERAGHHSGGVLFRVDLSRLEEGLGHEGFKCDRCGHTIKYVPKES